MFVVCVASNCLAVQLVCEGYLCKICFTKGESWSVRSLKQ